MDISLHEKARMMATFERNKERFPKGIPIMWGFAKDYDCHGVLRYNEEKDKYYVYATSYNHMRCIVELEAFHDGTMAMYGGSVAKSAHWKFKYEQYCKLS